MTTDHQTREIAGPAGMLFVDDGGEGGIPVALIHSFGGSTAQWAAQLEHLRRTRRAIAFDLRGHGRSDAPADGDYAVASLAADTGAVLDALSLSRVVLVGHSLGAATAIEYAGSHP
jgi:pimeloyl-ACP methyl ester carboxylesterase